MATPQFKLPDPVEYSDYRGRRNIDDKLDEVIAAINDIIDYLKAKERADEPN